MSDNDTALVKFIRITNDKIPKVIKPNILFSICSHSRVKMVYKVFCDREYRLNLKFENIYISLRFNFIVNKLRFYWQLIKMVIRSRENSIGAWAFLIGVILAVIVGIFAGSYTNPLLLLIIVILGLVVGYFVPEKNAQTFLFASMASLIASFAGIQGLATDVALRGITVL